jgi:hypothetical protein
MAEPNSTDKRALPEGLEPISGGPSTSMFTEPFAQTGGPELPEGLVRSSPSFPQRAKEVGIGTAQGAARDAPVVAGALTGLRLGLPLGLAATPAIGPFAAAIPAATTLLGAGAGLLFGSELDRWFPAVEREDLIPYREGGKTFGSALATAPAAFGLPQMTASRVGRFVTSLGDMARRNPKKFLAAEAIIAGTAGVAGGASESFAPGQAGTRFTAEFGAAVLTPTKLLLSGFDLAKAGLSKARSAATGRGAAMESKASMLLLDAIEKSGESPEELIRALRLQIPGSVPSPTSGQKTGSRALMDLESSLAEHHAQFGGETKQQALSSMRAYQALVNGLQDIGTPDAFRMAAQLREQNFNNMINTRLSQADAQAAQKIVNINKDTPQARSQIGAIVKTETEDALRAARDYESALWTKAVDDLTAPVSTKVQQTVPMDGPQAQEIFDRTGVWPKVTLTDNVLRLPIVKPSATADAFLRRAASVGEALYDDAIPSPVRKIMEQMGVTKEGVQNFKAGKATQEYLDTRQVPNSFMPDVSDLNVDELVNYRSTLLKMAREAAGKGDLNNADFYGTIAEGMLQDLNTISNPAFDQARQFSRSLNDTFTRTFAKTASATGDMTKAGAERLPAEILVQRAFGRNADVTIQRMEQIEDAVKFMGTQYDDAVKTFGADSAQAVSLKPMADMSRESVVSVQDAQNRVLRMLAADSVKSVYDPVKQATVQRLDTVKLNKFVDQYRPTLQKLGILDDLTDAATAQNLLTQVTAQNNALGKAAAKQTAFSQVLSVENPSRALGDALNSRFPVKNITNMAKLARAGGSDAVDGMKSALYDYAYTKAGGNSGRFSIQAFDDAFFKPIAQNQPSLINIMRASGLMTLTEVKDMRRLINPMARIESAVKNNIPLDDVIQGADAVTELALRVVGARIGTAASPGGPGSLIAASAGSKAVRQIFDKLPNATIRQVLENAVKDPEVMALLLEKARTPKQERDIANKVLDFLGAQGIAIGAKATTPALNYIAAEEPRPAQLQEGVNVPLTPQGQAARQLRMLPQAPSTRGLPKPAAPAGGNKPGPGAQSSAAPQGNARAMLESLFPFDTISAMAAQQGQPPAQG